MIGPGSNLIDVAFAVCTALDRIGEPALLVGGSAATFYAPEAYQSRDCDFILNFGVRGVDVGAALATIGYRRKDEGLYQHVDVLYTVEFPMGPPAIGEDVITTWNTIHRTAEILHVYSPSDVVRDRFMHFWA